MGGFQVMASYTTVSGHGLQNRQLARAETGRPDTILVREARGGNTRAYGELVRRYQDRLYNLIYGLIQNHDDALDLTQEVFLRAHTSLSHFREDAVFYTWLYRIALNACIDFNRRKKRSVEPFSLDGELLSDVGFEPPDRRPSSQPERALENKELGRLLRQAIERLPEPLRIAVVLHDVEGLQQKEIAALLKCPIGTVKSRIQRGRCELRVKLLPFVEGDR
jgi:RNA polymerase sigma-70 factor, ECF subfamily